MPNWKDITGQRYGKLTVIERDLSKQSTATYWTCKCDCGNVVSVRGSNLRASNNPTRSCGCLNKEKNKERIDMTSLVGKTFGRLTVLERDLTKPYGHGYNSYWKCKCSCGNEISVAKADLNRGHTKSCGCLKSERLRNRSALDLTNQRFGHVVALKQLPQQNAHHSYLWLCKCDCGNNNYICSAENLRSGRIHSCGCQRRSYGEELISNILSQNNISYKTEYSFDDLRSDKGVLLRFDFCIFDNQGQIQRLIEFDGEQHYNPTSKYYSKTIVEHDELKNNYAKLHNIPLVRIPYDELPYLSLDLIMSSKYLK